MISPWERGRANGTETRIISSFIDCGIGCFPFRTGSRETTTYFLLNLLRASSLFYISFWQAFGRRTCDGCSTKNLSFSVRFFIPGYQCGTISLMCFIRLEIDLLV